MHSAASPPYDGFFHDHFFVYKIWSAVSADEITMRRILIIYSFYFCIAALTFAFVTGCGNNPRTETTGTQENVETVMPERVVSMSPNLTQIIFALSAEDCLVGVDDYSNYPPQAMALPKMGNYMDPDLEALAAAEPDLVLIVQNDEGMGELLTNLGLEYRVLANDTISEITESIERLGDLLDRKEEATMLVENYSDALAAVTSALEGVEKRRVALVVGRNPGRLQDIYVAGHGSYLGEIIDAAGGVNVFDDQMIAWPQVGVEALVGANPEVIIDSTLAKGATEGEFDALLHDWDELPTLSAVSEGHVIIARDGWFQIPGAYLESILFLFAHWIHPEIFPDEVENPNLINE